MEIIKNKELQSNIKLVKDRISKKGAIEANIACFTCLIPLNICLRFKEEFNIDDNTCFFKDYIYILIAILYFFREHLEDILDNNILSLDLNRFIRVLIQRKDIANIRTLYIIDYITKLEIPTLIRKLEGNSYSLSSKDSIERDKDLEFNNIEDKEDNIEIELDFNTKRLSLTKEFNKEIEKDNRSIDINKESVEIDNRSFNIEYRNIEEDNRSIEKDNRSIDIDLTIPSPDSNIELSLEESLGFNIKERLKNSPKASIIKEKDSSIGFFKQFTKKNRIIEKEEESNSKEKNIENNNRKHKKDISRDLEGNNKEDRSRKKVASLYLF